MNLKPTLRLNIRQKIGVGLTICLLTIGLVGGTSYRYLHEIERRENLVELAYDVSNTILEMRRYEKNYLLYRSTSDLNENQKYRRHLKTVLATVTGEMKGLAAAPYVYLLGERSLDYESLMNQMVRCSTIGNQGCDKKLEGDLRQCGKALVEYSNRLVQFERERILDILGTLENQLLLSLIVFLAMGVFLVGLASRKIISPLKMIEQTTIKIAQGNFKSLPVQRNSRDETQRVIEAFNRMVEELEKRQEQLLQARKLSSIGILASGIAHQLNNPLNNISTSCQILIEEGAGADPGFVRQMLDNIEQEIQRARDTVKGLLEFAREREFAPSRAELWRVVERSVRLISSQVPTGIQIEKDIPKDLMLDLDVQEMQEVFLNLIMNAVQAIETVPGRIRISARADESEGCCIITVADTGTGIPEEVADKIFDPFFTTKEVGIGTGLGLSIVYGVIQKHKGTVSVKSRVGEGTTFVIRLPLKRTSECVKHESL